MKSTTSRRVNTAPRSSTPDAASALTASVTGHISGKASWRAVEVVLAILSFQRTKGISLRSRNDAPAQSMIAVFFGAGGGTRTPTGISALRIFVPATAFAARAAALIAPRRVCGLDYPFAVL